MANRWQAIHQAQVERGRQGLDSNNPSEAEIQAIMQRDQAAFLKLATAQAAAAKNADPDAGLSAEDYRQMFG